MKRRTAFKWLRPTVKFGPSGYFGWVAKDGKCIATYGPVCWSAFRRFARKGVGWYGIAIGCLIAPAKSGWDVVWRKRKYLNAKRAGLRLPEPPRCPDCGSLMLPYAYRDEGWVTGWECTDWGCWRDGVDDPAIPWPFVEERVRGDAWEALGIKVVFG